MRILDVETGAKRAGLARGGTAFGATRPLVCLSTILACSAGLRLYLVFSGGRFFWPDEGRMRSSLEAARRILAGDYLSGFSPAAMDVSHLGFKMAAALVLTADVAAGTDWLFATVFFSLVSVLNIALVYQLARELRLGRAEALASAAFMAACACGLTWSRHFMPYDLSLCLGLAALCLAAGARDAGYAPDLRRFCAGFCAAWAFFVYNGYFILPVFAFALAVMAARGGWQRQVKAGAVFALGSILAVEVFTILAGRSLPGLLRELASFSGTIDQGDFGDGFGFPLAYFWQSEGLLAVFWLVALGYAAWAWLIRRDRVLGMVLAAVLALYLGLGLLCERGVFVLYGRICREYLPLASLASGVFAARLLGWRTPMVHTTSKVLLVVLCVAVTGNFIPILGQRFPEDFKRIASDRHSKMKLKNIAYVNTEYFYPDPPDNSALDIEKTIERSPHPLQYRPYAYEGFNKAQRERLWRTDIAMKLVVLRPGPGEQ